jgi:ribosomal protein L7/L12
MAGPLPQEVRLALSRGQRFEALRILRAQTGLGLQEAVAALESGLLPDQGDGLTAASGLPLDVAAALAEGTTIEAVRLLQQRTGLGLRQARAVVEEARRHQAAASPRQPLPAIVLSLAAILALAGGTVAWQLRGREDACGPGAGAIDPAFSAELMRPGTQDCPDP